jgi:hypothetical protein
MGPSLYGIPVAILVYRDGPPTRPRTTITPQTRTRQNPRRTCPYHCRHNQHQPTPMDSCPLPSFVLTLKNPARIACTPRLRPIVGTWSPRHRRVWPNYGTRPPGNSRKHSNKHRRRHQCHQLPRQMAPVATAALGRICPILPVAVAVVNGSGTRPFVPIPATSSRPVAITWRACGICARAMWCDNITVTSRPSRVSPSTTAAFKSMREKPASTQDLFVQEPIIQLPAARWLTKGIGESNTSMWPCAMIETTTMSILTVMT